MKPITELISEIAPFDAILKPIANMPVDITDPDWLEKLSAIDPLSRVGIKSQAENLLSLILARYAEGTEEDRKALREAFQTFRSFAWAATPKAAPPTRAGFRAHLLLLSIQDQGDDPRDTLMSIEHLRSAALHSGVDIGPLMQETAELSSSIDRYGMGSMKEMLTRPLHSTRR